MRGLLTALLAGLIFACPLLCGADEIGHGAQYGHAAGDEGGDSHNQCPEGSDGCVCKGAVLSADMKAATTSQRVSPPLFILAPKLTVLPPPHHFTWNGAPTGLAGWGGSLTVRAYLQNFRF